MSAGDPAGNTPRPATRAACLNTHGRTPTEKDLAAVDRFAEILDARGWVQNHAEVVDAVAQAGRLNWDDYDSEKQERTRRAAGVWLTAARMAGVPLTGEIQDWRNPAPEFTRKGNPVPVSTIQYIDGLLAMGVAGTHPETNAAMAAAKVELDGDRWDDLDPNEQERLVQLAKQWLFAANFVGLTIRATPSADDGAAPEHGAPR